jgi:hypothetical protein
MEHPTTYVPKSGDKVSVSGHIGQFIVHSVDNKRHTVDVRLIDPTEAVNVAGFPWKTLKLLSRKREDVNQAAARIIREATEKD